MQGKPKSKDDLEKLYPRLANKQWTVDTWYTASGSSTAGTAGTRKLLLHQERSVSMRVLHSIGLRAQNGSRPADPPTRSEDATRKPGVVEDSVEVKDTSILGKIHSLLGRAPLLASTSNATEDPAHMDRRLEARCLQELQASKLITLRF